MKPWNSGGPSLSHGIATSAKTLKDIKNDVRFTYSSHTSTTNMGNEEQKWKLYAIYENSKINKSTLINKHYKIIMKLIKILSKLISLVKMFIFT